MDNKKGFTLIELLIVVVIIGILAAIAIPRFGETRERAFRSSMTSDLRNLQTVQEQYYFDSAPAYDYWTGTLDETDNDLDFSVSDGVSIAVSASGDGYEATATHAALPGEQCVLSVGVEDTNQGIVCTEAP